MNQVRLVASLAALVMVAACAGGKDNDADTTAAVAPATDTAAAHAGHATAGAMLDPNTATAEELMTLPSMDSASANAIVAGRPYANMLAVNNKLTRLSETQRDSLYTRLFMPIDINKATPQEIELIPGVGPKMRHEFEEYRPWTSIGQFRREIGKYVDSTEVARLERYITLR